MTRAARRPLACLLLALLPSCNVTSHGEAGECLPLEGPPGERGLVVIDSDYGSTNVALIDWTGEGKARSLLSSGGARAGLSAALSGDVVAPSSAAAQSGEVVVLDRTAGVVTWVDPSRCEVRGQLSVGPKSNPYDYLELSKSKAYVARNGESADPAAGPLERGADVLVVDPEAREARGSIPLSAFVPPDPPGLGPYPAALLRWSHGSSERVLVLLQTFGEKSDYSVEGPAVLVALDPATDSASYSLELEGVKNCGAATALPEGGVVVGCTGRLSLDGTSPEPGTSALIVLVPGDGGRLVESFRVQAHDLGGAPLSPYLAQAGPGQVVVGSYGNRDAGLGDRWLLVDLESRSLAQIVAESVEPFVLGSIACRSGHDPGSAVVCVGADASAGAARLRRFHREGGRLLEEPSPPSPDPYGLPPRSLGLL